MGRELRRVLIVIVASAAGFGALVLLRLLAGEPALQPSDIWVVLIWMIAAALLILIAVTTGGTRPPSSRGPRSTRRR